MSPGATTDFQVLVRRFTERDTRAAVDAIRTLKRRVNEGAAVDEAAMRTFLAREENVLVVACAEATPVGYVVAYLLDRVDGVRPMVLLYEVEVDAEHRGAGIGRALVEQVTNLAREIAAAKTWALTDPANAPARRLYASCGAGPASEQLLFAWSGRDNAPDVE